MMISRGRHAGAVSLGDISAARYVRLRYPGTIRGRRRLSAGSSLFDVQFHPLQIPALIVRFPDKEKRRTPWPVRANWETLPLASVKLNSPPSWKGATTSAVSVVPVGRVSEPNVSINAE